MTEIFARIERAEHAPKTLESVEHCNDFQVEEVLVVYESIC